MRSAPLNAADFANFEMYKRDLLVDSAHKSFGNVICPFCLFDYVSGSMFCIMIGTDRFLCLYRCLIIINFYYCYYYRCTFNTGEQCAEWWRRLSTALSPMGSVQETFAAAYAAWAKEQPPASVHRALMRASHAPHRYWFGPEVSINVLIIAWYNITN